MTRVVLVVALLVALIGGAYWLGGRDDRLQQIIDIDETEDRINEATTGNDGCGWFDRLHGTCP